MAHGTVKWFNPTRAFGLIVPDDLRQEVFVDLSSIQAGRRQAERGPVRYVRRRADRKRPRPTLWSEPPPGAAAWPHCPLGGEDTD